jgi:hypothetical protein
MVSVERLRELLSVHEDGSLVWRSTNSNRAPAGSPVSATKNRAGYLRVGIDGKRYYAHRVVFALVHGRWPVGIDHINGNRSDNRPENIREASASQNMINRMADPRNTSGHRGVHFDKAHKRWLASIVVNGASKHLGRFLSWRDAAETYVLASLEHHGEFSPFWSRTA